MTPERLIDVSVVARRLNVTPATVRNWIHAGKVQAVRTLSGRYKVKPGEADRLSALIVPTGRENAACGVYFIRCGPYTKIGYAADVVGRFNSIALSNPGEIALTGFIRHGSVQSALEHEKLLHRQFERYLHRNEWFVTDPAIAEFIRDTPLESADSDRNATISKRAAFSLNRSAAL